MDKPFRKREKKQIVVSFFFPTCWALSIGHLNVSREWRSSCQRQKVIVKMAESLSWDQGGAYARQVRAHAPATRVDWVCRWRGGRNKWTQGVCITNIFIQFKKKCSLVSLSRRNKGEKKKRNVPLFGHRTTTERNSRSQIIIIIIIR